MLYRNMHIRLIIRHQSYQIQTRFCRNSCNLFYNAPCPHPCTWMHNNIQNNYNQYAVKFGSTKIMTLLLQNAFMYYRFELNIIMMQYVYVSSYSWSIRHTSTKYLSWSQYGYLDTYYNTHFSLRSRNGSKLEPQLCLQWNCAVHHWADKAQVTSLMLKMKQYSNSLKYLLSANCYLVTSPKYFRKVERK